MSDRVAELTAAYERAELACDELVRAEEAASARWERAARAASVARERADAAWRVYRAAVGAGESCR